MRFFKFSTLAFALILSAGFTTQLQAQETQSDYEIQKEFQEEYRSIEDGLGEAGESDETDELVERADQLESDFQEHEELLDDVLYPETFSGLIDKLQRRATSTHETVVQIEEQEEKLNALSDEASGYESELEELKQRTDSLQNVLQNTAQERSQLANTVENYRESMRQRDELILDMIDSLIVAYQNLEDIEDIETSEEARLDADNVLASIQSIAEDNIAVLDSDDALGTGEYLRMKSVHSEFEEMWEQIGNRLVEIYAEAEGEREETDELVNEWGEKVSSRTWAALNQSFNEANVNLPEFDDQDSFYNSLNSYLDDVITTSEESNTEEDYEQYQQFSDLWNEQVKLRWSEYILEGDVLSSEQIARIDQKMDQWAVNAEPQSNLLLYLLGLSVLVIIILGVLLARGRQET